MTTQELLLGAHVSISGGVHLSIGRGEALGCTAIQIFTSNATQWKAGPLTAGQVAAFRREQERTGIVVAAHDSYLINLGSPDRTILAKSLEAFRRELERAEQLGIRLLVMHPGAATGSSENEALRSVTRSLNRLLRDSSGFGVSIILENTAGQGTVLGYSFEQLAMIMAESVAPEKMGVCLDTCHAFAAGYDLSTAAGYAATMDEFHHVIGLERLKVVHLNDSKKPLGSRIDRHEHLGNGTIGIECFRLIMKDERLRNVPKIIETPKKLGNVDMDPVNLNLLRRMANTNFHGVERHNES